MTTIVVVKKDNQIAIAADTLVTFGETRLSNAYEVNDKLVRVGDSWVGLCGSTAHFPVMRSLLNSMENCHLDTREQVFDTFVRIHQTLKEKYFLNTKEDEEDPYESSQITALIANRNGIYGVYSYREVFNFERFWGIGSGKAFSLGAMHAVYNRRGITARQIAEIGVQAGAEFDKNSAGPFRVEVIDAAAKTE
jgi:ATP-dependent protease HslVU (ClpYQ) peptidase subunit